MTSWNPERRREKGFTLVEILIVVVILGILAAIVVPQFTNASETARASSLTTQLQSLRSQLELYQLQHNGQYPANATLFGLLTVPTMANHAIVAPGTVGSVGPYLHKAAVNPFVPGVNAAQLPLGAVVVGNSAAAAPGYAADTGWVYSDLTGEIRACFPTGLQAARDLGLDDADVMAPAP